MHIAFQKRLGTKIATTTILSVIFSIFCSETNKYIESFDYLKEKKNILLNYFIDSYPLRWLRKWAGNCDELVSHIVVQQVFLFLSL